MIITTESGFLVFDYAIIALAIVCNCLVLQGAVYSKFSLVGYRRFLLSLIASDIFICVVRLLLYLNQSLSEFNKWPSANTIHHCASSILRSLLTLGLFTNLLNLCAMSIDHFIGIAHPIRYRYIMGKGIAKRSVIIVWIASICFAFTDVFVLTAVYYARPHSDITHVNQGNSPYRMPFADSNVTTDNCSAFVSSTTIAKVASITAPTRARRKKEPRKMSKTGEERLGIFLNRRSSTLFLKTNLDQVSKSANNTERSSSSTLWNRYTPLKSKFRPRKLCNRITILPSNVNETSEFRVKNDTDDESVNLHELNLDELLAIEEFVNKELKTEIDMSKPMELCQRKLNKTGQLSSWRENMDPSDTAATSQRGQLPGPSDTGLWVFINANKIWNEAILVVWALVSFVILSICYLRIYARLRKQKLDKTRHSIAKFLGTTWLLLGVFAITWMPLMLYEMSMFAIALITRRTVVSSATYFFIHDVFNSLFVCNPFLDIVIYVVRVTPVQKALRERYRLLLCWLPKQKHRPTIRNFVYHLAKPLRAITRHNSPSSRFGSFVVASSSFLGQEPSLCSSGGTDNNLRLTKSVDLALREELKSYNRHIRFSRMESGKSCFSNSSNNQNNHEDAEIGTASTQLSFETNDRTPPVVRYLRRTRDTIALVNTNSLGL